MACYSYKGKKYTQEEIISTINNESSFGSWKYETFDDKLKIEETEPTKILEELFAKQEAKGSMLKVSDIVSDELARAYPQLQDIRVELSGADDTSVAYYHNKGLAGKIINVANFYNYDGASLGTPQSIILHEIQHSIQDIEGFSSGASAILFNFASNIIDKRGVYDIFKNIKKANNAISVINSNPLSFRDKQYLSTLYNNLGNFSKFISVVNLFRDWNNTTTDYEKYRRVIGEVEARNVQERLNLTKEQRESTLLLYTEDISREDQLFLKMNSSNIENDNRQELQFFAEQLEKTKLAKSVNILSSQDIEQELVKRGVDAKLAKQVIGEKGVINLNKDFITDGLVSAKEMESAGKTVQEIRLATGWEKNLSDSKWRYEIQDTSFNDAAIDFSISMPIFENPVAKISLEEIYKNEDLYKAYPNIKSTNIYVFETTNPLYDESKMFVYKNEIYINKRDYDTKGDRLRISNKEGGDLLHEIQHLVQKIEGFGRGSSISWNRERIIDSVNFIRSKDKSNGTRTEVGRKYDDYIRKTLQQKLSNETFNNIISTNDVPAEFIADNIKLDIYKVFAGEVEARNVAERASLSEGERKSITLAETQSTPYNKQFLYNLGLNLTTNGFVDLKTNEVFINKDTADGSTMIHEYQHIYAKWLQENRKEVYEKGLSLIEEELNKDNSEIQSIIDYVRQTQPNLQGGEQKIEILTELIGRKGYELVKEQSGILDFIKEVWDDLKNLLGLSNYTLDQIMQMDLNEFAKASAVDLLGGEKIEKAQEYFTRNADRLPLTLQVFERPEFKAMQGKQVNPITVLNSLNQSGIKQIEKDLIKSVIEDNYQGQKKVFYDELEASVRANIMPLERIFTSSYADYGMDNLGNGDYGNANTIILNAPIEHGITGHFSGAFKAEGRKDIKYVSKQLNDNTWVAVEENYQEQGANNNNIYQFVGTAGTKEAVEGWIDNYNLTSKNWVVFEDQYYKGSGTPSKKLKSFDTEEEVKKFIQENKDKYKGTLDYIEREQVSDINKGMFAHMRVWQDGDIFYVAEAQSDYFQKNNTRKNILESRKEYTDVQKESENENMELRITQRIAFNKLKNLGYRFITGRKEGKTQTEIYSPLNTFGQPLGESLGVKIEKTGNTFAINYKDAVEGGNYYGTKELAEEYLEKYKNEERFEIENVQPLSLESMPKELKEDYIFLTQDFYTKVKEVEKNLTKETEKIINSLPKAEKQFIASQKEWEKRLFREALKEASLSGATTFRLPTPYTLSVIEGYVEGNTETLDLKDKTKGDIFDYLSDNYPKEVIVVEDLGDRLEIWTISDDDTTQTESFEEFSQEYPNVKLRENTLTDFTLEERDDVMFDTYYYDVQKGLVYYNNYKSEIIGKNAGSYSKQDFSIANLNDTQQTVARKYEELARLLEVERGAENIETITDENGFDWIETKIQPEEINKPVVAFQKAPFKQEQPLFYQAQDGKNYSTYKEALLKTNEGVVKVGTVEDNKFKEQYSVDVTSDNITFGGKINSLIRMGLLSGETYFDEKGNKIQKTDGFSNVKKAIVAEEVRAYFKRGTKILSNGDVILSDSTQTIAKTDGSKVAFKPQELVEKTFQELEKEFQDPIGIIGVLEKPSDDTSNKNDLEIVPENELQLKLLAFLKKLGVRTLDLSSYLEQYQNKYHVAPSANALANIAEQVIAFRDGLISVEDLAEETAHFIVAATPIAQKENLLRNINKTEEWLQFSQEYREIYSQTLSGEALENAVREEVLGKVLANAMQRQFAQEESHTETQKNIVAKLLEILETFFNKVNSLFEDSFRQELDAFTDQVYTNLMAENLEADTSNFKNYNFNMFSTKENEMFKNLNQIADYLKVQENQLMKNKTSLNKEEIGKLKKIAEEQIQNEIHTAINSAQNIANNQVSYLERVIRKNANVKDKFPLTQGEYAVFQTFEQRLSPVLEELAQRMNPNDKVEKKLISQIEEVMTRFKRIKAEVAIKENTTLDALIIAATVKYNYTPEQAKEYRDFLKAEQKDTSWFHAHLGTLVNARDPLLGLASAIISRTHIEQREGTLDDVKPFAALLEKLGITGGKLKQLVDGIYVTNEVDLELYDKTILEEKINIFNKIKGATLTEKQYIKLDVDGLIDSKGVDVNKLDAQQGEEFLKQIKAFEDNFRVTFFTEEFLKEQELLFSKIDKDALAFHKKNRRFMSDIRANAVRVNGRMIFDSNDTDAIKKLNRDRAIASSPRNFEGKLKEGLTEELVDSNIELSINVAESDEDARIAFGLYEIAKITKAQFAKNGTINKGIPDVFRDMVRQNATTLNLTKKQQLEFLFNNAYVGFNDSFWANFGKDDSRYVKLVNAGEKELAENIRDQEQIVSAILKQNRLPNRPSETDVSEMNIAERSAVKEATQTLESLYQDAKTRLKSETKKDEEDIPFFENRVNQSYVEDLSELDINTLGEELEFIKSHTTQSGKKAISKFEAFVNSYKKGDKISEYYSNFVSENMTQEQMKDTLIPFAQSRILPYYKRIEPKGFTELMESVSDENGMSVEDFMKNELVNVTPNYSFYDTQDSKSVNQEYLANKKAGKPQIKLKTVVNGKPYDFTSKKFTNLFGNVVNNVPQRNADLWQAREGLLELQKKTLGKYGITDSHSLMLLPQVGKRGMRQIQDLLEKRDKVTAVEFLKDIISFRDDEKEYGSTFGAIPQYYVKRLENPLDVTDDILYSYGLMNQQANLYQARVNNIGDMLAVEMELKKDNRYAGGKATNTLKMFKSYMDYNFYGVKETFNYTVNIAGVKVDLAAIARRFHKWIQLVNLTGAVVPITSMLQGTIVKRIETAVGETINNTASNLANKEYLRLAPAAMREVLQINSKSDLNVKMEWLGVYDIVQNRFENSIYSKFGRGLDKWAQITHEFANFPVIPRTALAVMYDYRYVKNELGAVQIMNFNEFQRNSQGKNKKDILKEWKSFELLYDDIKVENGLTVFNESVILKKLGREKDAKFDRLLKDIKENMTNRAAQAIQRIDSQIPAHEKSLAARHGIAAFFLLHSNWFLLGIQQRFKSRGHNAPTGQFEEGTYITLKNFASKMAFGFDRKGGQTYMKHIKDVWTNSMNDDTTRRNLHRVTLDMAFVNTMLVLSYLLSNYMDDDDDPSNLLRLTDYFLYRVTNEQLSGTIALPNQFLKALDSPIKGIQRLTDLGDLATGVLFDGDLVKSGKFAGETERARYLYNNVPALKDIYNLRNIEGTKNTYKHFNDDNEIWTGLAYYLMKEDEE